MRVYSPCNNRFPLFLIVADYLKGVSFLWARHLHECLFREVMLAPGLHLALKWNTTGNRIVTQKLTNCTKIFDNNRCRAHGRIQALHTEQPHAHERKKTPKRLQLLITGGTLTYIASFLNVACNWRLLEVSPLCIDSSQCAKSHSVVRGILRKGEFT